MPPAVGRREVMGGTVAIAMVGWPGSALAADATYGLIRKITAKTASGRLLIAGFDSIARTRPISGVRKK